MTLLTAMLRQQPCWRSRQRRAACWNRGPATGGQARPAAPCAGSSGHANGTAGHPPPRASGRV